MKATSICQLAEHDVEFKHEENNENKVYVTNNAVMAIQTSNKAIKGILDQYNYDTENQNVNEQINKMEWDSKVKIPTEYLKVRLEFLKKNKDIESVTLHTKTDYPVCFEIEELKTKVIVAPRIEED